MNHRDYHIQGPQINQFNNIAPEPIPRSSFRRDFTRRTTFNADYLIPCFVDEILPGDEVNLRMNALVRMTTPIKPVMENIYLESFFFFIPNRLVWDNWEKFQGQQANPDSSTDYTIPILNPAAAPLSTTGFTVESVFDYLGLPINVTGLDDISALYNRAIDLIWNEWFRDENIQNSLVISTGDGPDAASTYALRKRNKRKDYLTSALPWPQKGDAVSIALTGDAPVLGIGKENNSFNTGVPTAFYESDGTTSTYNNWRSIDYAGGVNSRFAIEGTGATGYPNIRASLDGVSAVTINALRQAALYQQILELDARGGTRYVESVYSRFGVVLPDFRVQRPELIGQGSTRIGVYAVPQTGPTDAESPQGNLAAYAMAGITGNHGCRYYATEHGMIIGLMNVRADLTYQQKIPRMFTRSTRLDFYEPLLNGLGEQAVLNREIYAQGTSDDTEVFGYQERFAEYRYKDSEITGKFRSTAAASLDIWHLSQEFGALPALNSSFIEENVPMDRILAITDESDFLADIHFSYNHVRPMPIRSNPGIDRL